MTVTDIGYYRQGEVVHPRDAEDLEFDEANEAHLAHHHITALEVVQVWWSEPVYVPNRKGLAAAWLMFGDTDAGRSLTIAVVVDDIRSRLRPITGWDSTSGELTRWRRERA